MPLIPATEDEMRAQGFPDDLQAAFQQTAEETRCVILSRVPGPATTELIAAGHDLKGFFIKAKSCDWGPMTGFLCQVPAFNKKGVRGIKHNADNNVTYHKKFCDRLRPPRESVGAQDTPDATDRIKSIVKANKLKWQEAWEAPLLGTDKDPIETTRNFLKERLGEDPISRLSKLVSDDAKVLTDNPDAIKADERFQPRLSAVVHDLRVLVGDDSPFVPLKLTQRVFERFVGTERPKGKEEEEDDSKYIRTIGDITCGVACNGDSKNFVCCAYVIKKKEQEKQKTGGEATQELYELYHGEIRFRDNEDNEYKDEQDFLTALQAKKGKLAVDAPSLEVLFPLKEGHRLEKLCPADDVGDIVKALEETWGSFKSGRKLTNYQPKFSADYTFYPIKGIQNYYPPFSDRESYKNAVTGDYDLFACWPMIPRGGIEELTRGDERTATRDTLFSRMPRNRYSLQTTASPNVLVEIIPTFKELEGSPSSHPSFGYISNDRVLAVAGQLNSFAALRSAGTAQRNVAFHGDEGGRPEIDEVDYAVAAFVPKTLMAIVSKDLIKPEPGHDSQMFIIREHVHLLTLIKALKTLCYVPLNFAWVYDFLTSTGGDVEDVKRLLKEVFWTDAADSNHTNLKDAFAKLFDRKSKMTSEQKVALLADLKAVPESAS